MKRFTQHLLEKYLTRVKANYSPDSQEVFVNPSKQEVKQLLSGWADFYRAVLDGTKLIAWNELLHDTIFDKLKLSKGVIPIVVNPYGNSAYINVTDTSDRTIWHHNPNVANIIRNHPQLKKHYREIEVGYYDQTIVGDWEQL